MNESEISYEFVIGENKHKSIELTNKISKRLAIDFNIVAKIIRANVLTVRQLSILSGKADSTIRNLMRQTYGKNGPETLLTSVYPFRTGSDWGPVFILFDEKCAEFLMDTFKPID